MTKAKDSYADYHAMYPPGTRVRVRADRAVRAGHTGTVTEEQPNNCMLVRIKLDNPPIGKNTYTEIWGNRLEVLK